MKQITNICQSLIILFVLFFSLTGYSQDKHPRVVELQKLLGQEGLQLLKGRFPDRPFLISVKIDPFKRERSQKAGPQEKLPYYDLADEEIVDEWDDPAVTNVALLNRVRKIQINLSVPSSLTDDEIAELKTTLINNLSLVEARDSVDIIKRNWGSLQDPDWTWSKVAFTLMTWVFFMMGLFVIAWYISAQIKKSTLTTKKSGDASADTNPLPLASGLTKNTLQDLDEKSMATGSDLRFSDPIKNREMISTGVKLLEAHKCFPYLEDLLILQKMAETSPAELGSLLSEFPFEMRMRIFGLSFDSNWLEALSNPGEITSHCVETLNKLLRIQRSENEVHWQELLILVWRLEKKRSDFFKGLDPKQAFKILNALPKSMALAVSREIFPGSWGQLLDVNAPLEPLSQSEIETQKKRALSLVPIRNSQMLAQYRNIREILNFLKTADPITEKEVYTAAGDVSLLKDLRPPFYLVLSLNENEYSTLVPQFGIEEWALAMLNLNRPERKEIEKYFGDKQKHRYLEMLKAFDQNPPSRLRVGEVRERIGILIRKIQDDTSRANNAVNINTDTTPPLEPAKKRPEKRAA